MRPSWRKISRTGFARVKGAVNRGVHTADFRVVRKAVYPAVLVECGYLSNRSEGREARNGDYRELLADKIAQAIVEQRHGVGAYRASAPASRKSGTATATAAAAAAATETGAPPARRRSRAGAADAERALERELFRAGRSLVEIRGVSSTAMAIPCAATANLTALSRQVFELKALNVCD